MTPARDIAETGRLADRIAAVVASCPQVTGLAGGPIATYLPGRVVQGVAVGEDQVRIAVVAAYGPPMAEVADQVRAAVRSVAPKLRIDVMIEDLRVPGGATEGR